MRKEVKSARSGFLEHYHRACRGGGTAAEIPHYSRPYRTISLSMYLRRLDRLLIQKSEVLWLILQKVPGHRRRSLFARQQAWSVNCHGSIPSSWFSLS